MPAYVALIHGKPGAYGLSVLDLPGCTSGGETVDEALRRGHDAAVSWVEAVSEDGTPIPPPRILEELRTDPQFAGDFEDVVAVGLVEVDIPGRVLRLNITLDEALAARIDRAARQAGETRSGWLAQAARARLGAGTGSPGRHPRLETTRNKPRRART